MSSDHALYDPDGMRSGAVPLDEAGARARELSQRLASVLGPWVSGSDPGTRAFGAQIAEPGGQMVQGLDSIGRLFQQGYAEGVRRAADRADETIDANVANVPEM